MLTAYVPIEVVRVPRLAFWVGRRWLNDLKDQWFRTLRQQVTAAYKPSIPALTAKSPKMFNMLLQIFILSLPYLQATALHTSIEGRQAGFCNAGVLLCCQTTLPVSSGKTLFRPRDVLTVDIVTKQSTDPSLQTIGELLGIPIPTPTAGQLTGGSYDNYAYRILQMFWISFS